MSLGFVIYAIVLTAYTRESNQQQAFPVGCQPHPAQSIASAVLISAIAQVLRS